MHELENDPEFAALMAELCEEWERWWDSSPDEDGDYE
jgi:hypothetical protein